MISTSWMSRLRPACRPPEIMLTMGSGSVGAEAIRSRSPGSSRSRQSRLRWTNSSSPRAAAAAWATASETPSSALAPRRPLLGVPSSASSFASRAALVVESMPITAGAITEVTLIHGLEHAETSIARAAGVAQLKGLVSARAGSGGDDGAAKGARGGDRVDLDRWPAARVEHLPGLQLLERDHDAILPFPIVKVHRGAGELIDRAARASRPRFAVGPEGHREPAAAPCSCPAGSRYSTGLLPSTRASRHAAAWSMARGTSALRLPRARLRRSPGKRPRTGASVPQAAAGRPPRLDPGG